MPKHIVKKHDWGPVCGFEFGITFLGTSFMTVYAYYIDNTLIDTAQSRMRPAVIEAFDHLQIGKILLTHHHEDHSGNAAILQKLKNVPVLAHKLTAAKLKNTFKIHPYQKFMWGPAPVVRCDPLPEIIESENYRFLPIHTPGHSKDHTVYLEQNEGWVFSGDLYLGDRIKVFRRDENMVRTIESLKKLLSFEFDVIYCSHHPRLSQGKTHIRNKLHFLEDFHGKVMALQTQGMNQNQIFKQMDLQEEWNMKTITMGDVSKLNMVRSSLKHGQKKMK